MSVWGSGSTPRFDSLASAPSASAYGVGPAWIGGVQYWSDGTRYIKKSETEWNVNILTIPNGGKFDNSNSDAGNYIYLDSAAWTNYSAGTGTPIWDGTNSLGVVRYGTLGSQIRFGNTTAGVLGTVSHKRRLLPLVMDMTNIETFTFWFYVDGPIVLDSYNAGTGMQIQVAFYDAGIANANHILLNGSAAGYFHKGWNNVTVTKAEITSVLAGTGTPWATLGAFRIGCYSPQGHQDTGTTFILDSMFYGGELPNGKAPVCVTLDDGHENSLDMIRVMNAHGIKCTACIPHEYLPTRGSTNYAILAQLNDIYNMGNDIILHAQQANQFSLDPSTFIAGKQKLIDAGFTRNGGHLYMAYPNGTYNQTSIDAAKSAGMLGGRAIDAVVRNDSTGSEAGRGCPGTVYENVLNGGLGDEFRITAHAPTTAASALASVDAAIAHKAAYISYSHAIGDAITSMAEWVSYAKGLRDRVRAGTIECMTFPCFVDRYKYR